MINTVVPFLCSPLFKVCIYNANDMQISCKFSIFIQWVMMMMRRRLWCAHIILINTTKCIVLLIIMLLIIKTTRLRQRNLNKTFSGLLCVWSAVRVVGARSSGTRST